MQQSLFILLATQSSLHLDNPKKIEIYPISLSLEPVLERIQPKSGHLHMNGLNSTEYAIFVFSGSSLASRRSSPAYLLPLCSFVIIAVNVKVHMYPLTLNHFFLCDADNLIAYFGANGLQQKHVLSNLEI